MIEHTENQAYTNSVADAFNSWISDNKSPSYTLVQANILRKIGCAIADCGVRTISPAFIGRSDLPIPYSRMDQRLCACTLNDPMPVRLPFPFHQKQTHIVSFLPAE